MVYSREFQENSIPIFRNWNASVKFHSWLLGRELEAGIPGNSREREFPLTPAEIPSNPSHPSTYSSKAEKGQTEQDENAGVRLIIQNWNNTNNLYRKKTFAAQWESLEIVLKTLQNLSIKYQPGIASKHNWIQSEDTKQYSKGSDEQRHLPSAFGNLGNYWTKQVRYFY